MPSDQMIGVDASSAERLTRRCSGCGKEDDHPRDVIDNGDPDVELNYHIDCHANLGCAACQAKLDGWDGSTGAGMLDHLLATPAFAVEHELIEQDRPEEN